MTIKLTVSYDGTDYCGWQVQKNGKSVQSVIEDAVFLLTKQKVRVTGSGRTDAGVHAVGQVASFCVENCSVPPENFSKALNTLLPNDIKIIKSQRAGDNFNARKSAKKKTYRYSVYKSDIALPLFERYYARIDQKVKLDFEKMESAANLLSGRHDFKCFNASDGGAKSTVRTIYNIDIRQTERDGVSVIDFYVCGNGFLYNMVRTLVGTLIKAGEGKMGKEEIIKMLNGGDRSLCGKTMAAKGLTLYSVEYVE